MDSEEAHPIAQKRRACAACTAAKAKCSPRSDQVCERCARLGKACRYLDMPGRRRKQRSTRQIESLESTVEELKAQVALLARRPQSPGITPDSNISSAAASYEIQDESTVHPVCSGSNRLSPGQPEERHWQRGSSLGTIDSFVPWESEQHLRTYMDNLVPMFPFVPLPLDTTASQLRRSSPFLYLGIVIAAIGLGHPLRRDLVQRAIDQICDRVVCKSERNMDILQGLLVLTAWSNHAQPQDTKHMTMFVSFARSVCYDLDLHSRTDLGMEEQRALLGTFWLSSCLGRSLGKPVEMKFTNRMKGFVESLSASHQYSSDRWIEPFVLVQAFVARIDDSYAGLEETTPSPSKESLIRVIVESNLREFQNLRSKISDNIGDCPEPTRRLLSLQLYHAEICVREAVIRDHLTAQPGSGTSHPSITPETSEARRSILWPLFRAARTFSEVLSSAPVDMVLQWPLMPSCQLCSIVVTQGVASWALLESITGNAPDPAPLSQGQLREAREIIEEADYLGLLGQLTKALEAMRSKIASQGSSDAGDTASQLIAKLRIFSQTYPAKVTSIMGQELPLFERTAATPSEAYMRSGPPADPSPKVVLACGETLDANELNTMFQVYRPRGP